ncbi:EKC/KEOPS complexsubunit Gon7 [Penicillium sp. IBT 31633x]|nr:EKC/KEOPS complexsubunit Gon7 [Penicillium sp. IBT 31633x]
MASNTISLNAVYTAPQATKSFEHVIPTTTGTLAAKQAHLSALQSLVPKLQEEINIFLTERMEEDKKVQGKLSAQEAKEEENYGEEVVEDDA